MTTTGQQQIPGPRAKCAVEGCVRGAESPGPNGFRICDHHYWEGKLTVTDDGRLIAETE
jgi:hypothetical protein